MGHARVWLLTLALAPAVTTAQDVAPKVYSGQYFYNFENANFTLDGAKECWVVSGGLKEAEIAAPNGSATWGTAHVVVRGVLSPAGHYGNLGACTHVLKVVEIMEISDKKAH
jgi:hypothetical protein